MTERISEELLVALPSLKQKFLVDLVNGIDVSRDHIKIQKDRDGFTNRLWDSFTGDAHRRQSQISELVVTGLESCFEWLGELTEQLTFTNTALTQISEGLVRVKLDLANVANFSADTRQQLKYFKDAVDQHMTELEARIREVDMRQRAYQQMDSLFLSWDAGNFSALSLAQRCFLVISELAWGVFADYGRIASPLDRDQILMDLRNRLIVKIMRDAGLKRDDRVDSQIWLEVGQLTSGPALQCRQALQYLGDRLSDSAQGFNWYVVNKGPKRPTKVPYIMDASRLVTGMSNELIRDGQLYVG
jgi:hypothetical protein